MADLLEGGETFLAKGGPIETEAPFVSLSVTCRERDLDRGLPGSDADCAIPIGGWAIAFVVWVDGGAGEAGREGRLRMGRVRSAFMMFDDRG